jgi:hypothetical protein
MESDDKPNFSGFESTTMKYDDGQCAICWVPQINKSLPDCGHFYCYQCLVDWCHFKLECLHKKKKNLPYFYHSVRSPEDRQIYIPERPSTHDGGGHTIVLHEPKVANDPDDPEFLRAFDQMLRISEIRPENSIDALESGGCFRGIFGQLELRQALFNRSTYHW